MTSTTTTTPGPSALGSLRQDSRTIGLVGLAHGSSHFFHLLLPPLFPWLIADFGFSYSELSVLVSAFFIVSGVGQALAGFVVDRFGARPIMFAALSSFAVAGVIAGTANSYAGLMLAAIFAGLGNAPFHPVDFTILNKRLSPQRLGHGFSVHGLSGNLGWAAAPVFMAGITSATGSWRIACLCGAALAAIILVIMVINRDALDDRVSLPGAAPAKSAVAGKQEHPMAFLKLPSVWLCFSFFFWTTCAMSAIQSFSSPALQQLYGLPASITAYVVTGYMLFGAAGMVLGGFLVGRVERLEKVISACLLFSGVLLALVGTGWLPGYAALGVAALAGIGTGLAGPSRDMLVKRAAPPGATGRVYGMVYSGLDLGFCLAAPVFGYMLDHHMNAGVFFGAAVGMVLSVVSAGFVGAGVAARKQKAAAVPA
ncbi:MFS family permease [Comamonas sp. BIGb0152]|uniref:MFS transporter n=1 Tax=Comamonas sp. BIGb0152 TaxID=2940601 RepID=UPI002167BC22|nr:MFS transporter [Comamonas sp. BIGb0152]MCS4294093.1 MFS family permease [Comamonas sp. BIGb0152]